MAVGDLIYDEYIRHQLKFVEPRCDLRFLNILFKSIFRVYNTILFLNLYNIKKIFTSTEAYVSNHSLLLRLGLKKKYLVI